MRGVQNGLQGRRLGAHHVNLQAHQILSRHTPTPECPLNTQTLILLHMNVKLVDLVESLCGLRGYGQSSMHVRRGRPRSTGRPGSAASRSCFKLPTLYTCQNSLLATATIFYILLKHFTLYS